MLVNKSHLEATQALQQHLEKAMGEVFEKVKLLVMDLHLLGEAIHTQKNMENVIRGNADMQ